MTNAERDAFVNVKGQQSWQAFRARMDTASSLEDAFAIARTGAVKPQAGWGYYDHLRLFLRTFNVPRGATPAEKVLYGEFIRRLERGGELKRERAWEVLEKLNR